MRPIAKLVLASHNAGKLREIADLLAPYDVSVVSAGDFGLPEPEETGATFEENALIKARASARATGLPALADDSGLAVRALAGQPGIHSARWAGPDKDFYAAMKTIEQKLEGKSDRAAAFICALALVWPEGEEKVFLGRVDGHLVWPPRGDRGFGYDPVFVPEGGDKTFAEIEPAAKHAISHRADAFRKLVAAVFA